ncbi:hypothetical protein KUTeg_000783 [Tegillarca granosa]|uniref:Mab-21-like HhH/H2TH-like domain-containing protein n=1 Tax=Tegillarca granosa TaxID=220873 RepID=A0ABQ9FYI8_TEGGR|nr:hypothetical protein KUTeg_000783 [Tegillarca granosa]
MENISVMIWNHLFKIFGTAEEVYVRRQQFQLMDLIFNRMKEHGGFILISIGSKAEGLNIEGSDLDFMFVFNKVSVDCLNGDSVSHGDIIIDTNNIKPGFARLNCQDMSCLSNTFFTAAVTETKNGIAFSSLLFRHILTWPVVAAEWIHRYRGNNWPSRDLITEIVRNGCLIVPIWNPEAQDSFMQWRISFSVAEKKLVYSMNHTEFLCYALLKLYLKHVVNSHHRVKKLLCSYFLKTCLFYCIEEEDITWNKNNFLDCFWTCFRRIIKWVRDEYCPNFFIKENNMFEGNICGDKGRLLFTYLSELYDEGLLSLSRIPCLAWLQCFFMTPEVAPSPLTDVEKEYICDRRTLLDLEVDEFP